MKSIRIAQLTLTAALPLLVSCGAQVSEGPRDYGYHEPVRDDRPHRVREHVSVRVEEPAPAHIPLKPGASPYDSTVVTKPSPYDR